jgi:DNA-binding protein H-NS
MPASKYQKRSLKELIAEREDINAAITEKQAAEREAFKAEMAAKASMLGLDLRAVWRAPVAVKFRNPKNPSETWSGRGRPARWLVRETDGDKRKFDRFLVR